MLIKKLKDELNLMYNIVSYKKLVRQFLYTKFEKNNVNLLYHCLENMTVDKIFIK